MTFEITIDMDKKCAECRKPGAVTNSLCIGCTSKALSGKPMKSGIGKAVQERINRNMASRRKESNCHEY